MLTSFLSNGSSSSSSSHPTARSGEVDPEPADASLPRSLRHVQSFETSAYSVIGIPTSPKADQEFNGLGRTGAIDGPDAAACRLFKPLPPQPQQPYQHSTPRKIFSKIFGIGNGGNGSVRGKSKRVSIRRDADVDDADYPLDGEEGELIDDEACFVDAKEVSGFDILSQLPDELALHVISQLDLHSLIACLSVCHNWRALCLDPQVWRDLFMRQKGWKVNTALAAWKASQRTPAPPFITYSPSTVSRRLSLSFTLPSLASRRLSQYSTSSNPPLTRPLSLVLPTWDEGTVPLSLDWKALYTTRRELEQRWRSKSYKPQSLKLSDHRDSVYCLEFDSIHNVLVTGSRDKTIKIWSLTTGELRQTLKDHHSGSVLCLKAIAAEGFMVSGSSDRTIIVWELGGLGKESGEVTGTVKRVLSGHAGGVLDLRVDENWIVSCSKDAVVRVWSRHTLEPYCDLMGHEGPVNAVGLQGDHVISASGDGKMILWDLQTRSKVRTFEGHDRGLACVEFKGDHIISGSNDRKIKIWSASTGECLHTVSGHDLLVRAISFDAESGKLISASYDKTVKVWDLDGGEIVVGKKTNVTATCVREFKDYHTSHIFDVKFDARRIVSSSHDENIVILDFGEDLDTSLFL
ncbi:hypothetical protein M407DRAFT_77366 [Tulasnella calospora MUT 4182]|uniref:F-box domain-containing protein n=1 Tax=Tulasnella calospora MUT 4182 TaxID=1051891 RepID=A0A0C3QE69_9AGAM|nr:hypothetical protein M407DRAFT_77366 [Tulasnella calospora MUT 4182]